MRKLIILVFIIVFIGSASAAEQTYYFTAEIYRFEDTSGIFSELGYVDGMPIKGTITMDTEAVLTYGNLIDPYVTGACGMWDTGLVMFNNQGYEWLDSSTRNLFTYNDPATMMSLMKIWTKQFSLAANSEVTEVQQMVTINSDVLDASMPADLNLGISPEYKVQIMKGGALSIFDANITEIMDEEAYASATAVKVAADAKKQKKAQNCRENREWKNHGQYVKSVAQDAKKRKIRKRERNTLVSQAAQSDVGKREE